MLDTAYLDGYSIFEFTFNKDKPNMNRYKQFDDIRDTHVSVRDFFGTTAMVLVLNRTITMINAHLECDGSDEWFRTFLSCTNGGYQSLNIPWSILKTFEKSEFNLQAIFIIHNQLLMGIILVYWFTSDLLLELDDISFKSCRLVGGGPFYPRIDLQMHNIDDISKSINEIDRLFLNKCIHNVGYIQSMLHCVGFVCNPSKMIWNGDHKAQYSFFGMSGATGTNPCPVCLTNKQQIWDKPTPQSRCWSSRTFKQIYEAWVNLSGNAGQYNIQHNLQHIPLLVAGPESGGLADLHIFQGIGGRCWRIVQEILRTKPGNSSSDVDVSTGDEDSSTNVSINKWRKSLNQKDELFCQLQQSQEAMEWLELDENRDVFENMDSNALEVKLNEMKEKIVDLQKQYHDLLKNIETMETVLFDTDSELQFLTLCDRLKIKPWHYKDDSMLGSSVKKYLTNFTIVIKALKKRDPECARIMEPCLSRLNFIAKCIWTKSEQFFSQECINYLKFNIIEFDFLYHKLIEKYGGGTGRRYGVKFHGLYHCLEWIEHFKWAPAFVDEQHLEAFNLYIRKFAIIYLCFGGHINMEKMMTKIWRNFALN